MTKLLNTALLVVILFLGVCYGQERADTAKRDGELARLEQEAKVLSETTARAVVSLARERQRGDSLTRIAQAAVRRRDRAVVSSDSTVARVDSALADSASPPPADTLRTLLVDLRASLLSERSAASVAIASLEETIAAKDAALAQADSVILFQNQLVSTLRSSVELASRKPPLYRRVVSGATQVAVGVAIGAVLLR